MKVLVISNNPFSRITNNGKTLEAIFYAFSKEELCQLFFRPLGNDVDWEFCSSYYMVTDNDLVQNLKFSNVCVGKEIFENDGKLDDIYSNAPRNSFSWKRLLREFLWKTNMWKNGRLRKWSLKMQPDIIFFVGGNCAFAFDVTMYIANMLKIPIVTYFTDDYIIYPKYNNFFSKIHLCILKKKYRKIIRSSVGLFCIGEKMSKEYGNYFGVDFKTIMNLIEIPECPVRQQKFTHVIAYFGGLHLMRWKTIARVASLVPENVQVCVYTFQSLNREILDAFESSRVVLMKGLSGKDLQLAIANSDMLLHVESDEEQYMSITKLSVSTKIPEYLISGRPILAVGPIDVASIELLKENGIGYVVDSRDHDAELSDKICSFLDNNELQKTMALEAYNYAVAHFDKKKEATQFKTEIFSLLES